MQVHSRQKARTIQIGGVPPANWRGAASKLVGCHLQISGVPPANWWGATCKLEEFFVVINVAHSTNQLAVRNTTVLY
jgi:hypothetical protein